MCTTGKIVPLVLVLVLVQVAFAQVEVARREIEVSREVNVDASMLMGAWFGGYSDKQVSDEIMGQVELAMVEKCPGYVPVRVADLSAAKGQAYRKADGKSFEECCENRAMKNAMSFTYIDGTCTDYQYWRQDINSVLKKTQTEPGNAVMYMKMWNPNITGCLLPDGSFVGEGGQKFEWDVNLPGEEDVPCLGKNFYCDGGNLTIAEIQWDLFEGRCIKHFSGNITNVNATGGIDACDNVMNAQVVSVSSQEEMEKLFTYIDNLNLANIPFPLNLRKNSNGTYEWVKPVHNPDTNEISWEMSGVIYPESGLRWSETGGNGTCVVANGTQIQGVDCTFEPTSFLCERNYPQHLSFKNTA